VNTPVSIQKMENPLQIKNKKLEKKLSLLTEELQTKNRELLEKDLKIYDLEASITRNKIAFEDYKRNVKKKLNTLKKMIDEL
jgi:hypothetical protein